jgi:hypothetical protein
MLFAKTFRQFPDKFRPKVAQRRSFGQGKSAVDSGIREGLFVTRNVAFVGVKEKIPYVEKTSGPKRPADFGDKLFERVVGNNTGYKRHKNYPVEKTVFRRDNVVFRKEKSRAGNSAFRRGAFRPGL